MKRFRKIVAGVLIPSFLLQPLGLVSPALAETVEMEYTDPNHTHAPKVVNAVEYQYDANGNLVNDGERVISWNQDNLPTRVEKDEKVVEFFYDANGQRIVKQAGENKTVYVNQYYQEPSTKYYFANGRVAQSVDDNLTFLHQDHLGSTVLLTNSNSQKITEPLSYFPYGSFVNNPIIQSSNNPRYFFTNQELDDETNLYNYNARLYNPTTGSFISADTVGSGNRYAYAANNPIMFVDPSGKDPISVFLWVLYETFLGRGVQSAYGDLYYRDPTSGEIYDTTTMVAVDPSSLPADVVSQIVGVPKEQYLAGSASTREIAKDITVDVAAGEVAGRAVGWGLKRATRAVAKQLLKRSGVGNVIPVLESMEGTAAREGVEQGLEVGARELTNRGVYVDLSSPRKAAIEIFGSRLSGGTVSGYFYADGSGIFVNVVRQNKVIRFLTGLGSPRDKLGVLGHETIHAFQYLYGETLPELPAYLWYSGTLPRWATTLWEIGAVDVGRIVQAVREE